MQDRVGDSFDGLVTAVTSFGLFVELTDIYVEGLLHITALPADYYEFDAVHHSLIGERSGRRFRLGDSVRVQVARVDLDDRKIDFEMAADTPQAPVERQVSASRAMREKLLADARRAAGEVPPRGNAPRKGRSDASTGKPGGGARSKTARPAKAPAGGKADGKGAAPTSRGPRKRKAR
jgi:ribonuclease R